MQRLVAGVEAASVSTLTLEGAVAPTAAPASAPGALEEATAKWPVKWYWVVGGILLLGLLVAVLFLVGRNVNKE